VRFNAENKQKYRTQQHKAHRGARSPRCRRHGNAGDYIFNHVGDEQYNERYQQRQGDRLILAGWSHGAERTENAKSFMI